MDDKEPAVQNQGQNSPGRRTHLARGDETGQHQIQSVGLTDLGKDLDSLPGATGSHWRVASREKFGFTFKTITLPGGWTTVGRSGSQEPR